MQTPIFEMQPAMTIIIENTDSITTQCMLRLTINLQVSEKSYKIINNHLHLQAVAELQRMPINMVKLKAY